MSDFDTVEDVILDLQKGKLVVVVDDETRENEGDLIGIAEIITPEQINFMIHQGGGLICVPMEKTRLQELTLPQMVANNQESQKTKFTVSVDSIETHTGISASERALTINQLANPNFNKDHFVRPGHVFPIECHEKGLLGRKGHSEIAVTLAKLAGFFPAGVICEILNPDGSISRRNDLLKFTKHYELKYISVNNLIDFSTSNVSQSTT